jgi:hypothetical protein
MMFSVGRCFEIQRTHGSLFIRAPFLGEVLWNRSGLAHAPWRKVKAWREVHALLQRLDAWSDEPRVTLER